MTRIKLNNDLLKLWQEHKFTVIFVTHSVYESVYLSNRVVVMASRPGRVIDEIAIPVPYPRGEAYRESAQYTQLCRETSTSLHRAMERVRHRSLSRRNRYVFFRTNLEHRRLVQCRRDRGRPARQRARRERFLRCAVPSAWSLCRSAAWEILVRAAITCPIHHSGAQCDLAHARRATGGHCRYRCCSR